MDQFRKDEGERRLQANNPKGGSIEFDLSFLERMRGMIRSNHINASIGETLFDCFNIPGGSQRWIHLQIRVKGTKAGNVIDLYSKELAPADEIDLGAFDLKKGQNELTIEIVGANEKAAKKYVVVLDYIRLK